MKRASILFILFAFASYSIAQAQTDNTVEIAYNGTTATVTVADNISQHLTVTQQGAHVSIAQSDSLASEITYRLTGTSTDGEFYMSGSYKATVELNGLTLTNATPVYSGAAIHIQNGKRINVKVITGTTNTLVDAANGSQKGCLYVKGHAEFKQQGTLNVVGNVKHAIKAGEYISLKNATLNITSAVGDGISCNQYFLMEMTASSATWRATLPPPSPRTTRTRTAAISILRAATSPSTAPPSPPRASRRPAIFSSPVNLSLM